jgi:hypothetical protein
MAIGLDTGAQSASLDVVWKAKGGDLGGTGLVVGVSRSMESMVLLCLGIYGCRTQFYGGVLCTGCRWRLEIGE